MCGLTHRHIWNGLFVRAASGAACRAFERANDMAGDRNRTSLTTTGGSGRAPNRAMLRAVGFLDEDFDAPMIGVASLFSEITPCNAHLDRLARKGCEGIRSAGGVPQIFGAPTASDGIMMGHQGMR